MGLSNSQYQAILREYDRIQSRHRAEREDRLREVYEAIPRMEELNSMSGKLALESYQKIKASNDRSLLDKLTMSVKELTKKKQELLKEYGFPDDYMDLKYDCSICKDTAYVDFKKCSCFNKKVRDLLYAKSNMQKVLDKENFDTFSFEYFDDSKDISHIGKSVKEYMKEIVALCQSFAKNFHTTHDNILFIGNTGVGKTFLSNCIAKVAIDNYHSVLYLSAIEFFEYLAAAKMEDEMYAKEIAEQIMEADLLIIDDLGTELVNSFTSSQLFYIINHRLNNEKSSIISTNLSLKLLRDNYSERLISRLISNYNIIQLYGDDIRTKLIY